MRQGIVMEIQSRNAFVFTNECSLVRIPVRKDMFVGQSIQLPEIPAAAASRRRWLVPALAAACLALLVCTGFLLSALVLPQAGTVYLSLDINPSVEFTLNDHRVVTNVQPMNSDAWELLQQIDLTGLTYDEAISRWVTLVRENYPEQLDELLISAILTSRDRDFADILMALNGMQAGDHLSALQGLNVSVLYDTDPKIREQALANGLSIGRQILLNRARERQLSLDADDIRQSPLQDLIGLLLADTADPSAPATEPITGSLSEVIETEPVFTSAETTAPTTDATSEVTSTAETAPAETIAQTAATTKATTQATTRATTPATTQNENELQLSAVNDSSGWRLQWTAAPTSKTLAYYKVVISRSVSQPKYPDNGYLTVGEKYYVSITYVYQESAKSYSNTLYLKYYGPAYLAPTTCTTAETTAEEAFSPELAAAADSAGIQLNWTASPESRSLNYYKVVVSPTVAEPKYPDDGYLTYLCDRTANAYLINNSDAYQGGSFGDPPYLIPGESYYISITYVFNDGTKAYSTVRQVQYDGPAGP